MGALKKPKELSYDELNALALRLFRELEAAHEAMETMHRAVGDKLMDISNRSEKEKFWSENDRKMYRRFAMELRNLYGKYNDFPKKLQMLRTFMTQVKKDFRETAAEQWVRLEKFLSVTNMDGVYKDLVTGDRIEHLDNWIDADKQEEYVFNETRLYEALGKDDARMVLALWRRFHEVLMLRRRIDHEDDESTSKIDPKEVMFRFRESELFGKMFHLLNFSKSLLPKLKADEKKADKHTEPQYKNLQRQLGDLFDTLKRSASEEPSK